MERLGFLQLAKRFLQLGKDATTSPDDSDDDRYIQHRTPPTARPPAGRTLSLKIFNRIQQSASASPNGGGEGSGGIADQPRSRKKFHSVKEGGIHRKENADPRLRIASVGRKHVFAGCRVALKLGLFNNKKINFANTVYFRQILWKCANRESWFIGNFFTVPRRLYFPALQ